MSTEHNVLGLDLSLSAAGMVVLASDGEILAQLVAGESIPKLKSGKVSKQVLAKMRTERLLNIVREVLSLIAKFNVKTVYVEDFSYGDNLSQAEIGEIHGAVKYSVYKEAKLVVFPVPIKSARASVLGVGNGNIKKEAVRPLLQKRLGVVFRDHNAADAYVVAEFARKSVMGQGSETVAVKQLEMF